MSDEEPTFVIGGKHVDDMDRDELLRAVKERLRCNVGLLAENVELKKRIERLEHGGE